MENAKAFGEYFSEVMTTEEIFTAWDDIRGNISILQEAIRNRLDELNFDDDEYEDGASPEVDRLLELRDTLDTVSGL